MQKIILIVFLVLHSIIYSFCEYINFDSEEFKNISTFEVNYDFNSIYQTVKNYLKDNDIEIEKEDFLNGIIITKKRLIKLIQKESNYILPGQNINREIYEYADIKIFKISKNKTKIIIHFLNNEDEINKMELENRIKILKKYIEENAIALKGDLYVIINLKSEESIGKILIAKGFELTRSFEFKNKFIYLVPKNEFLKEVNVAKKEYKKINNLVDQEIFKAKFINSLFEKTFISFTASSEDEGSFISGKIYFDGKIIASASSHMPRGMINISANLGEYIIQYLDK